MAVLLRRRVVAVPVVALVVVALAIGGFLTARQWQREQPPERVAGEGAPLSAAPSPECPAGIVTTTPAPGGPAAGLDELAESRGRQLRAATRLRTYQVTFDRLPSASAQEAVITYADAAGTVLAAVAVTRVGSQNGGTWQVTREETCR